MTSLRAYQEELRKLLFFQDKEPAESFLWKDGIPDRLRVYRNNTRSNWSDALDCDFALTKKQFGEEDWGELRRKYFIKHPCGHWELNASLAPFPKFLSNQKVKAFVKELADYEWHDLQIFIDRTEVKRGMGVTNPTSAVRVYQHQIFFWAEDSAPPGSPPAQKPEVLVFYRDSRNTSRIVEADPLMLLLMEHFRKSNARLEDLEPVRDRLIPGNKVPLESALESLKEKELILL